MKPMLYALILIGILLVFYLSWLPSPFLKLVAFIPNWLARWTDQQVNEDLRTGIPFLFLGALVGLLPSRRPVSVIHSLRLWLILLGVVTIAEIGQLWLPRRHFSWVDIAWGAAGSLVGLAVAAALQKIKRHLI